MAGHGRHRAREPRLSRRAFLGAAAAVAAGCGRASPRLPDEVVAFHRDCTVLDLHVDTLLWQRLLGYDPLLRHEPRLPRSFAVGHFDLPRAREAGLDGALLFAVVSPREERPEQHASLKLLARVERGRGIEQTLETLGLLEEDARRAPEALVFARSGSELRAALASGRFAALAGLEGAHGLEGSLDNLRRAHARGLRVVGLVHFQASAAAWPMTHAPARGRGLSEFGFQLVEALQSLGMAVDLAHLNAAGVRDALGVLKRPFLVSHTACRAVHDHPRNLDDAQLRAVAERGGVVGLAVGRSFLGAGGLDAFVAHAEHLVRVAGAAGAALGSDWDGGITPVAGLEDVRGLPGLSHALLTRGWPERRVRGLLGENALEALVGATG